MLLCLSSVSCTMQRKANTGVAFLEVKLVDPDASHRGTADKPLPMPGPSTVKVTVSALDADGDPMDCADGHGCWEGAVTFNVTPGYLPKKNPNDDRARPWVPSMPGEVVATASGGHVDAFQLSLRGIFSETRVWAIEWGGMVNGQDRPARHVAGASEPLYIEAPSIQDMQYDPATMAPSCKTDTAHPCDSTSSPLVGNFVTSRRSRYWVNGIGNDGFFVTDIMAASAPAIGTYPGRFNSMFMYSYSYPQDLVNGDIVVRVNGTAQEFTGDTQLTFPAWEKEGEEVTISNPVEHTCAADADCYVGFGCVRAAPADPTGTCRYAPPPITEALCLDSISALGNRNLCGDSAKNVFLESLESARVEVTKALMPTSFVNCDFNGDGDVPNITPDTEPCGAGDEAEREECCKIKCIKDDGCSESSQLHTYGQYNVTMDGPGKIKINVVSRDSSPTVEPWTKNADGALAYGGVAVRVRGNLRQGLPARPKWIVLAGEKEDFCCLETGDRAPRCLEIPPCAP